MLGLPPKGPDGFIHIYGIVHARETLGRLMVHRKITKDQRRWIHKDLYDGSLSEWVQVEMVLVPVGSRYEVRLKSQKQERVYSPDSAGWWERIRDWWAGL